MATLIQDSIYPFHIESITDGWARSDFEHQTVNISVRRIPKGKGGQDEHIQVSIGIWETHGKPLRISMHTSLTLTPEQADVLINALKNPVTYQA